MRKKIGTKARAGSNSLVISFQGEISAPRLRLHPHLPCVVGPDQVHSYRPMGRCNGGGQNKGKVRGIRGAIKAEEENEYFKDLQTLGNVAVKIVKWKTHNQPFFLGGLQGR